MKSKIVLAGVLVVVCVLLLYPKGGNEVQKEQITVSGAWALYPMMVKWAEEYQKLNSGVTIEVSAGGAGKGMSDALSGLVDIGMISRDIDKSEIEKGAYPLAVAKDAVLPTMNKENALASEISKKGVRKQQFKGIFVSGAVSRWGEVAGISGDSDKISVYVRSDSCGAAEVWGKYLGVKQEDLVGVGVNADPGIAEAVSRDKNGIGFNNLNFAYDSKTGEPVGNLAIIPIDVNEDGVIGESESFYARKDDVVAAIADGRYPSPPARDLYLVTKGQPTGPSRDFIRWILTDGQKYVLEQGYILLKDEVLRAQAAKL
jgi:phosphate transport system substrate-binding protein